MVVGGEAAASSSHHRSYPPNERAENRKHQRRRRADRDARAGFDFFHSNLAPSERFILSRKNRANRMARRRQQLKSVFLFSYVLSSLKSESKIGRAHV